MDLDVSMSSTRRLEDSSAEATVQEAASKRMKKQDLLYALQSRSGMASLLSSPDSPQQISSCIESLDVGVGTERCQSSDPAASKDDESSSRERSARSALEELFQETKPSDSSVPDSDAGDSCSEDHHCKWVMSAICAALPLLKDVLPRDQCGTCVVPHPHPLKKVVLDDSHLRVTRTGVTFYRTSRVCDNCDEQISQKEYWCCGEPKASGGNCSVDFCCKCYDEMQELFAKCSMDNAAWAVRFINAAATHILHMPAAARQQLIRQFAFELPLPMFESLVRIVVDVNDASVVHIEDNIENVAEFEDFWHTLGFLDLLYAANLLPTTERRVGQVFLEGARLPSHRFVLQGIDKCEVYSDWKRWRATVDAEQQSDMMTASPFVINANFICFLSHNNFVPRAFLRKAVEYDANVVTSEITLQWRKLTFRRDPEALREDIITQLGQSFEIGHQVRLCGLRNAPELNGKEGELRSFDPEKGRWAVKLGDSQTTKSLKPINLLHVDEEILKEILKRPVDPRFSGENGAGPGVMREFFLLALQALISCTDFWEYNEEVRTYWFIDSTSLEAILAYRAVGVILGNAIRLDVLLPASFPDPLYSLLLRSLGSSKVGRWSLADLRKVSPHFARSFEQFIEYDKDDAASLFTLDWPRSDELETLPKDARGDYVQAYIDWFFDERFKAQSDAMIQGFGAVVGNSKMLSNLLSVEQFGQILNGIEEPVDIVAMRRKTTEVGWSNDEDKEYLEQFWQVITSFSEEQRRKFVVFVSSSSRAPLKGWSDFGLQVQKNGTGDERMPTAYTCFHLLLLPMYTSVELLRTRLLQAIHETQGFGLY